MACPTCDHTMSGIGYGMFHCPRCGTLTNCPADGAVTVPALVARCQKYRTAALDYDHDPRAVLLWTSLGIEESISKPD